MEKQTVPPAGRLPRAGKSNLHFKRRRRVGTPGPEPESATEVPVTAAPSATGVDDADIEHRQKLLDEAKQRKAQEDAARKEEEKLRARAAEETRAREAEPELPTSPATGETPVAEEPEPAPAEAAPEPRRVVAEAPPKGAEEAPPKRRGKTRTEPRRGSGREPSVRRQNKRPNWREIASTEEQEGRHRSMAQKRRQQERERRQRQRAAGGQPERVKIYRDVQIPDQITVQELAIRMAEASSDVVKKLAALGHPAMPDDVLDGDTAELVVAEFKHRPVRVSAADVDIGLGTEEDAPEQLKSRAPVVTVMGHVDHGKTSLLDTIRKTNVAAGEAGSITQHIGAYLVDAGGEKIVFLDTPGHAAFSAMRARGAGVTDIVVLVVAANDGLMPQTEEAIDHARAAGVPLVVAINKMDLPEASADQVRDNLLRKEVVVEDRGGDTQDVEISATTGAGIDNLLKAILAQSEQMELKANPDRPAEGTVIEAQLARGRGAVSTVLVERGTLRRGDIFVAGAQWGRIRALRDDRGQNAADAGPSVPVEIDGLNGIPEAGDKLVVVDSEARAREVAEYRERMLRERNQAPAIRSDNVGDLLSRARETRESGGPQSLALVIKADVQGSAEAITQALARIGNADVSVAIMHQGVGAISESDVNLAISSNARIIGFNVRPNGKAKEEAHNRGIEISYHSVIYELIDEVKQVASGLLAPETRETVRGKAEILEVFRVSKVGPVAGCRVVEGYAHKDSKARLVREGMVIYTGSVATLKRFKDDVPEVRAGTECGVGLTNCQDFRTGDEIEFFTTEEVERTL